MNRNSLITIISIIILAGLSACGNNRKDKAVEKIPEVTDTIQVPAEPAPKDMPVDIPVEKKSGPGDVLANINKYVVSTPTFNPLTPGSEGISNCTVTIHNTLDNTSFQKVIAEVSIILADGKEYRTDYYTVVNLEPGDKKLVKIPNTTRGVKVTSRIVKVKSTELTNGESVTVGNGYVPQ